MNGTDVTTSSKISGKQQYGAIDIMRMFMAICVLCIHRCYVMQNETFFVLVRHGVCELAVPFFVVTTAFFFYKKVVSCNDGSSDLILKKYIKRMVVLWVLWSVIYIPQVLYTEWLVDGKDFYTVFIQYLRKLVVDGETYFHLWYLQALIISSVLIFYLSKRLSTGKLLAVFYVLYCLYQFSDNCEIQEISEIYSSIPPALVNYTCRISVFILIGKMIAEQKKARSRRFNISSLIISFIVCYAFVFIRLSNKTLGAALQFLVLPLVVFFLFSVCLSINFSFKGQSEFRKITELFYFTHLLIPVGLYDTFFYPILKEKIYNIFIIMIFYTVFSIVASLLIIKASKIKKLKFLKYLY